MKRITLLMVLLLVGCTDGKRIQLAEPQSEAPGRDDMSSWSDWEKAPLVQTLTGKVKVFKKTSLHPLGHEVTYVSLWFTISETDEPWLVFNDYKLKSDLENLDGKQVQIVGVRGFYDGKPYLQVNSWRQQ